MEKLKEALIQFAHANPSLFPNDAGNSYPLLIEECFHQFFPDFQVPNHPTYAAMIYRAILELNKKGGSSEKSISKFIKKEYADLPWAHSTLLKHHLEKLCDLEEICMTHKHCYLLVGQELESQKKTVEPSKKPKKQKSRLGSEAGSRPHRKYKKKEKCVSEIQETCDKEQIGMHKKRKRKRILKSKRKSSKRVKKHAINEDTKLQLLNEVNLKQNVEVTENESHEQKQISEVNKGDIQIHEQNEAGQKSEESPDLNSIENGKLVCTRSRSKTILKKDALSGNSDLTDSTGYANMPEDKSDIVKPSSNEPLKPISSKLMAPVPDDEPTTGPGSTVVQDLKDLQLEKSTGEVKPKYKRRGRPPKSVKSHQKKKKKKGKVGNKKIQPKQKHDGGDKNTRRSSRNKTKS